MAAAPIRIRTHTADGETVEHCAASVSEALAAANLNTREARIAAIGAASKFLITSDDPELAFVGSALASWLETDRGRLERDFFRVLEPRSHLTVARVWRALRERTQNSEPRRRKRELP